MEINTKQLDHHGLVAATFDSLGIGQVIDKRMSKKRNHNVDYSTIVKAMVILGLGFVERRLYFAGSYFKNWAIDELLGEGVKAEDLNDDALGRTLDKIYDSGVTELFEEIAVKVMKKVKMGLHLIHVDTTSVSVSGNYEMEDTSNGFKITFGHSKEHRQDLKQFVIGMVVNQSGMPIFAKPYSGNKSDKKSIMEMVKRVRKSIDTESEVYYIADSAFYTLDNIRQMEGTYWISHVPSRLKESKTLLNKDVEFKATGLEGYSIYEETCEYGGVKQKWVLVKSEKMRARQLKNFDRHLEKRKAQAERSLNKAMRVKYFCKADALNGAQNWIREHRLFKYSHLKIKSMKLRKSGKRGRPSKNEEMVTLYKIEAEIDYEAQEIEKEKSKLGRFILASNDMELCGDSILTYYKRQSTVERGFRFLKDNSFRVSDVYLKKTSRIQALAMIMVLTLLVYSIAEWMIRTKLQNEKETIPNQINKPTNRPTLKWIFQLFMNITVVKVVIEGKIRTEIANVNEIQTKILRLLGGKYEKYYF